MARLERPGEVGLERLDFRTEDEPLAVADALDRRQHLGADRTVLGLQIQQRDGSGARFHHRTTISGTPQSARSLRSSTPVPSALAVVLSTSSTSRPSYGPSGARIGNHLRSPSRAYGCRCCSNSGLKVPPSTTPALNLTP